MLEPLPDYAFRDAVDHLERYYRDMGVPIQVTAIEKDQTKYTGMVHFTRNGQAYDAAFSCHPDHPRPSTFLGGALEAIRRTIEEAQKRANPLVGP